MLRIKSLPMVILERIPGYKSWAHIYKNKKCSISSSLVYYAKFMNEISLILSYFKLTTIVKDQA